MDNNIERRKQPRCEVKWPVAILTDQGTIEGEARNIGPGGIFIYCEEPLQLNEIFRMSIFPANHKAIEVTGKPVWSDLYGIDDRGKHVCMGVCFMETSDEDHRFLNDIALRTPE